MNEPIIPQEILYKAMNDNRNAAVLCNDILYIAHLWDDLIDKDKERTDNDINAAFEKALIFIPSNPFYKQYENEIRPMFHTAITSWYEANKRQTGNLDDKFYSFFLRNALLNVIYFSSLVTGGNISILHNLFSKTLRFKYEEFLKEGENNA